MRSLPQRVALAHEKEKNEKLIHKPTTHLTNQTSIFIFVFIHVKHVCLLQKMKQYGNIGVTVKASHASHLTRLPQILPDFSHSVYKLNTQMTVPT